MNKITQRLARGDPLPGKEWFEPERILEAQLAFRLLCLRSGSWPACHPPCPAERQEPTASGRSKTRVTVAR